MSLDVGTRLGRAQRARRRAAAAAAAVATLLAAGALLAPAAHADPLAVINTLRTKGCAKQPPAGKTVQRDKALDDVARALSRDSKLGPAIEKSPYPAQSSTMFHVKGARDDATVQKLLAERYCEPINDLRYADLGAFQSGDETWIVLAARRKADPVLEPAAVARRVLELVNDARGFARKCGRTSYGATTPVALSATLTAAANAHVRDMAQHQNLDHTGSDGSAAAERITRAGYDWRAMGENIAAGQKDADAVVASWLASPGHCATLMGPQFTEMGIAFALAPGANPGIYWAQEFAAPR